MASLPSSITDFQHNFVPVAAWKADKGVEGSIPSSVKAGELYTNTYNVSIAHVPNIQDKENLSVVVLLLDKQFGTIVNAAQSIVKEKGTAINEVEGQSSVAGDQSVYDLSGRKLSTSQKGINIIRMNNGTVKKILVK